MRVAPRHAILMSVFLALFAGCYRYTAIKPTELPKLAGPSYGQVIDGPNAGNTVAVAVRQAETPDGKLVEIRGKFDVVIATAAATLTFEHPVAAVFRDGLLEVKSKNFAPVLLDPQKIKRVQIKQDDDRAFALGVLGASCAALLVTLVVL